MSKFLIIQTAFIGDVVLATAVIEKLHQHFPDAEIDCLVRKGNESLLENHPHINQLLVWDKKKNKLSNLFRLIVDIRKKKYNAVINLQRFFSTGLLTAFSGAHRKIGFNKNPLSFLFSKKIKHEFGTAQNPIHEVDRNLSLIKSFTDFKSIKPRLYPTANNFKTVETLKQQKYICVAPGSVWFTKQFPENKWIEFIRKVDASFVIYLVGSDTDKAMSERIKTACTGQNVHNLAGKLSLLETAALLKDAKMNYVNDSAPLHMASAMDAPVTAIFCSTVPTFGFGPLSEKSYIIQTEKKLTCKPCGLHGKNKCPQSHFDCANTIKVQQLMSTLC